MITVALSVAGVDPSGGAGVAADLKTFHQHGVYGCAVVTLLTVQNTQSLSRVEVLSPELVLEQLEAVLEDVAPAAIKTGALGSAAIVERIAPRLQAAGVPLVVDPVRVAKHGAALCADDARRPLLERLIPVASLLTVNADEAAWLAERPVEDEAQALAAAERLRSFGAKAVLVKGGHLRGEEAVDLLLTEAGLTRLRAPRLGARHLHGVGCTLAAAITANVALGLPLVSACEHAKRWLTAAIASAPGVGRGIGAVNHLEPVAPSAVSGKLGHRS